MLNKLKNRLKHNTLYIIIGLTSIIKGIIFWEEKQFFYYPPQFKNAMNSSWLDGAMILAGLLLVFYVLSDLDKNNVLGCLLAIIAGLLALVSIIEAEHVVFVGHIRLLQNIASNVAVIAFILWTARHRSKR